ncbi:MAG: tetratricopeptide repeat protein [Acinetobacter sp.]|nr:tetratricopeptide repeat protein [Acinetobacter sp.]
MKKVLMSAILGLTSLAANANYGTNNVSSAQYATMDIQSLNQAAKAGNAAAQFYLGSRLQRGQGVQQDNAQAFTWFKAAADQGLASAQLNVGRMYADGVGVKKDETLARKYFEKAASNGDNRASYNLAVMEEKKKNFVNAYQWYELSTRDGMLDNKVIRLSEGKKLALAANLSQDQIRTARDNADRWIQAQ